MKRPCFILIAPERVEVINYPPESLRLIVEDVLNMKPERMYWIREKEVVRLEVDLFKWGIFADKVRTLKYDDPKSAPIIINYLEMMRA